MRVLVNIILFLICILIVQIGVNMEREEVRFDTSLNDCQKDGLKSYECYDLLKHGSIAK